MLLTRHASTLLLLYLPAAATAGDTPAPPPPHAHLPLSAQVFTPDGDIYAYGSPLHNGWDKAIVAHNTLAVDQISHTWEALPPGQPSTPPQTPGCHDLKEATTRPAPAGGITRRTRVRDDWQPTITVAADAARTDLIKGYGIRKSTEDRVPMLLLRRVTRSTAFVWAVSLDGAPITLGASPATATAAPAAGPIPSDEAILVQVSDDKRRWLVLVNPTQRSVSAPLPEGGVWNTDAAFAIR